MSADFGKLPPTAKPYGGKWGAATHASVRDLWAHKALADATGRFSATVAPHETVVVKLAAKTDDSIEAKPITISCVGDSITVADGDQCYPSQLGRLLGAGYNVTNRGVSGHTMLNSGLCAASPAGSWRRPCLHTSDAKTCSGNCSYWSTPQFQATLASNPDIITIMLGTNDAKWCNWFGPPNGLPAGAGTQFAADYVKMIKLFKSLPSHPKVFVVLPPPGISQCSETGPAGNASVCLAYNMSFSAINEVFPKLQRQIAKDGGADGVIDVWSALNGSSCTTQAPGTNLEQAPCPHTADGIHPYADAQAIVAQTIAKGIGAAVVKTDDTVSGYWRLPGKRSSAVSKNSTTKQCAAAATGVAELAACCSDDPGCGGFAQSGTIHGASCSTSILCPPECARTGDSGCNCPASPAPGASSTLYVKSDVPQGGGALPTQAQLAWQEREVGAFVSWTIEEHCGPLGSGSSDFPNCWRHTPGSCTSQPDCGDCPDPDKFVISDDRFTDQWAASMRDLGVKYAVMVLKQHCGWTMWPTNVTLPDGSTCKIRYFLDLRCPSR